MKFILIFFLALTIAYTTPQCRMSESQSCVNASVNASDRDSLVIKTYHQTTFAKVDSILHSVIIAGVIPGAVIMITQGEQILHQKAFGHAQLYGFDKQPLVHPSPMSLEHRFDLASLTKVFATTYAIMLLVDDELIDLHAPVHTYLPSFSGPSKDSIMVRDLLIHAAGLYPWKPIYYHAKTSQEVYDYICQLPLAYPVGAGRHYSDLGFMLLGYIIEKVSGLTLDNYLEKRLYHPLQLADTGFNPTHDGPPFAVTSHGNPFEKRMVENDHFGYKCDEDPKSFNGWRDYVLDGEVNDGNAYYANGGVAGHAGLFSTAIDIKVLLDILLNKGKFKNKQIISSEVVKTFLTKSSFGHGLGWAMSPPAIPVDNLPIGVFGHTGFTGTFVLGIPIFDMSIILLTNRQNIGVNDTGHYNSITDLRKSVSEEIIKSFQ